MTLVAGIALGGCGAGTPVAERDCGWLEGNPDGVRQLANEIIKDMNSPNLTSDHVAGMIGVSCRDALNPSYRPAPHLVRRFLANPWNR